MLFLYLALALYRDYTTHKIHEGRKSKRYHFTNGGGGGGGGEDYNSEEEEGKKERRDRQRQET